MDFFIGGLAGASATVFTNPMDVVKTRMQLQGELRARSEHVIRYKSVPHALYVVAKTDGLYALQKGLRPAMLLGFCMNSIRLGTFRFVELQGWTKTKKGDIDIYKTLFWSSASGVMSCLANPIAVLKTRMQATAHPSIAVGRQHVYKGLLDGLVKIYKTEGIRGYYAGVNATCSKLAVGSSAQLTTFSTAKEILLSYGICKDSPLGLSFMASSLCGFVVVLVACPFDVIAIRLYNQGSASKANLLYNGVFDCLRKTYRTEGLHGLYKGIGPLYMRLAPHTTLTLVFWDMLNILFKNKKIH